MSARAIMPKPPLNVIRGSMWRLRALPALRAQDLPRLSGPLLPLSQAAVLCRSQLPLSPGQKPAQSQASWRWQQLSFFACLSKVPDQHAAWRGESFAGRPAWVDRSCPRRCKPGQRTALVFVRGDRFHQGHQLTLHGLILDLAVGPQQSQAERAIEKQQAFDLARLAVAVVEECDGYIQRGGDLLETGGADAIDALLIFLHLLKADAELVAELRLRDSLLHAPQPDSLPQFNVGFAGTALLHSLRC